MTRVTRTVKKIAKKRVAKKVTKKATASVPVKLYSYTDKTTGAWIEKQAKKNNISKAAFINQILTTARKQKLV